MIRRVFGLPKIQKPRILRSIFFGTGRALRKLAKALAKMLAPVLEKPKLLATITLKNINMKNKILVSF